MARTSNNTRLRILNAARQFMTESPDETLSMRRIASLCGISAGTIYNHFPDKSSLMAAIMIEDWHKALDDMETECMNARNMREGVAGIYHALEDFVEIYRSFWQEYRVPGNFNDMKGKRHKELISEISGYVRKLLVKFAGEKDLNMDRILAENMLNAAVQKEITLEMVLQLVSYIAK
jgi:AcrR family transcriptional regulator